MAKTKIKKILLNIRQPLFERIKSWVKNNPLEAILLAITLLLGAFLRLYRIDEYMTFLGDEGRDAIIVRRLWTDFDPILIGPGTSIGNMYLGPLYYYLIAPFLLLFNFSPVGPSVMVALLSIATIYLVWRAGREWFDKTAGIVAALLYAISPIVIIYSRSSWNPNILPFFSLLSVYAIWRVLKHDEFKWLIVLGFSLAMTLNSHYLALVLLPVIGVFWTFKLFELKNFKLIGNWKLEIRNFAKTSAIGLLVFAILMSPLVIFDARHEWRNFNAMKTFFTERQTTVSAKPWSSIPNLWPRFEKINTRLLAGTNEEVGNLVSQFLLLGIAGLVMLRVYGSKSKKIGLILNDDKNMAYIFLIVWLGISLVGLGVYKQEIYDHYYGFFFTAPFLLFGGLIEEAYLFARKQSSSIRIPVFTVLALLLGIMIIVNFSNSPIKQEPNRQMQRSEEVAGKIIEESEGKEFNLAVIAERNYEGAYQYFLERENAPLKMIDPQIADETITDQLFVVCELPKEKCDPTTNPKAGIANFGWSKVDKEWEVSGVILYKLIHNYPEDTSN